MTIKFEDINVKTCIAIGDALGVDPEKKLDYAQFKKKTEDAFEKAKDLVERKHKSDATLLTKGEWENLPKHEKMQFPFIWGVVNPEYHSNYYICAMQEALVNGWVIRKESWESLSEWDIIGIQQGRNLTPNLSNK